jgi:hypothetical protein
VGEGAGGVGGRRAFPCLLPTYKNYLKGDIIVSQLHDSKSPDTKKYGHQSCDPEPRRPAIFSRTQTELTYKQLRTLTMSGNYLIWPFRVKINSASLLLAHFLVAS